MAATQEEVNRLFATPGAELPADVQSELQAILRLHDIDAQELFYKWESYVIKMGVETTNMDYKTVKDFKKNLEDALDRESRAKNHVVQSATKKTAPTPRAPPGARRPAHFPPRQQIGGYGAALAPSGRQRLRGARPLNVDNIQTWKPRKPSGGTTAYDSTIELHSL